MAGPIDPSRSAALAPVAQFLAEAALQRQSSLLGLDNKPAPLTARPGEDPAAPPPSPPSPPTGAPPLPAPAPPAELEPAAGPGIAQMREIEADAIRSALREYDCNISKVSRALGISRSTIYRKMRENGLIREVRLS